MTSKYPEEDKIIKYTDYINKATQENKFQRLFNSIALILNVYGNDRNSRENEKILFVEGVNKVCEKLKSLFSTTNKSTSLKIRKSSEIQSFDDEPIAHIDEIKVPRISFVSKYLQNCQKVNKNSLCRNITSLRANKPYFRVCTESERLDFANKAAVMIKLRKYLKQHCQRAPLNSKLHVPCKASKLVTSSKNKTIVQPKHCDKGIQCTKSNEFLKVTPNLQLPSSIVDTKPQSENSSKLEYVANYHSEFPRQFDELRCCSSSAIRELQRNSRTPRRSEFQPSRDNCRQINSNKPKRKVRRSNTDNLRRAETEIFRRTNSIENDLASYRNREHDRYDILAIKKILLEDYITEIQEIIRGECNDETRVLNNVKRRLDEDVVSSARSESWHSASECTSYVTARETLSSHSRLDRDFDCWECNDLRFCRSCCFRKDYRFQRSMETCSDHKINRSRSGRFNYGATKSSQSVDSGVLVDYACPPSNWHISDESRSNSSINTNIELNENIKLKNGIDKSYYTKYKHSIDDLLCKKVESAVRKFTDELIVCERRVKHRSSSTSTRKIRRKHKIFLDENNSNTSDFTRNTSCSSEDEFLTSISAPSLVSLSD